MNLHARSRSRRIQNTRESRPSESKERWLPRLCTLEGFREDVHYRSGVDVRGLELLTRLSLEDATQRVFPDEAKRQLMAPAAECSSTFVEPNRISLVT